MLRHLFRCSACDERAPERLPLCSICAASLIRCPELCGGCGSPVCGPDECLRPWAPLHPLESLRAAYLFIGRGHGVLAAWKFRSGPLFDRSILRMDDPLRKGIQSLGLKAIVPLPQRFERAWQLKGSPAERIAAWVSRETGAPLVRALRVSGHLAERQTGGGAHARFANRTRFERAEKLPDGPVLLVDDFMTTGHTLRKAASALSGSRLHAFCLGLRLRGLEQKRGRLGERVRGAVAVGQAREA